MKNLLSVLALPLLFSLGCAKKNEFQPPPPPEVTVQQPVKKDVTVYTEFPGIGFQKGAAVHLGEGGDGIHFFSKVFVKSGDGAEGIDVAAHVDDVRRRASQFPRQFVDISTVSFDHF